MGSDRERSGVRSPRRVAAAAFALAAVVGCTSASDPGRATVTPTNAYTAVVRWEIEQTEPVTDADGNVEVPVIYLAAGSGGTVDVGVQADVVSEIDDAAVIRFADEASEARDDEIDNEPVKDDGVMISIDEFELDQATVDGRIVRYLSIDDDNAWILEITATTDGAVVASATLAPE